MEYLSNINFSIKLPEQLRTTDNRKTPEFSEIVPGNARAFLSFPFLFFHCRYFFALQVFEAQNNEHVSSICRRRPQKFVIKSIITINQSG